MQLSKLSFIIACMAILTANSFSADTYSPRQIEQMPSLALRRQGQGTLKVCSKPLDVTVYFQGHALTKNRAVLTVDDVQPGLYDVVFEGGGKRLMKKARIVPGETTIIFGSLDSPEAKPSEEVATPAATVAEEITPAQPAPAAPATTAAAPAAIAAAPAQSFNGSGAAELHDLKDAEIAYEYAELLRNAFNPFTASSRYNKALELYQRVWEKFPESPRIELAHYNAGRIYESMHLKNYAAAIEQYKTVLVINPQTATDAAERIAKLYGGVFEKEAQSQLGVIADGGQPAQQFTPQLDPGNSPTTVYSAQNEWQPQNAEPIAPEDSKFGGVTLQP